MQDYNQTTCPDRQAENRQPDRMQAADTPGMNSLLSEALSQSSDCTHMTFNFSGNHNSIAPKAINIQHFYGDAYAQAALKQSEAQAIMDMTPDEKRLFMMVGHVGETLACVSLLKLCQDVNDVAGVAVAMVKRQVVAAAVVKRSEFLERLIPFCTGIEHLSAKVVNVHINRLLKNEEE